MNTIQPTPPVVALKRPAHTPTSEEVARYMPLVRQVVSRCMRTLPKCVRHDELTSAGIEGLHDALSKGGGDQTGAFVGYARLRIHGAIMDELRALDWLSREERAKATAAATESGTASPRMLSLDDPCVSFEGVADTAMSPLEQLQAARDSAVLTHAVSSLSPREREVVEAYYLRDVPLTDVAAKLGVSVGRTSQLRARAVGKLRSLLEAAANAAAAASERSAA